MQVITILVLVSTFLQVVVRGRSALSKALIYSSAAANHNGNYTQALPHHITRQPSPQHLKAKDGRSSAKETHGKDEDVEYNEKAPVLELSKEWEQWQTEHGKRYLDVREMVERHIVWASNREYIEQHNKNALLLGYSLRMNQFGDLVKDILSTYIKTYMHVAHILCVYTT